MTLVEYAESIGAPLFPAQIAMMEAIQRGEAIRRPRGSGYKFMRRIAAEWMAHEAAART